MNTSNHFAQRNVISPHSEVGDQHLNKSTTATTKTQDQGVTCPSSIAVDAPESSNSNGSVQTYNHFSTLTNESDKQLDDVNATPPKVPKPPQTKDCTQTQAAGEVKT